MSQKLRSTLFVLLCSFISLTVAQSPASGSTSPSGCADAIDCSSYKDLCVNGAYEDLMRRKCPVTCNFCKTNPSACDDASTSCTDWAANNFCSSSSYSTAQKAQYCAKTCNLCGASNSTAHEGGASCVDSVSACASWVQNGFCTNGLYTKQQQQMYCAKSCGQCY